MLRRTKAKVTQRQVRDELQEGLDHIRSAAAIAAERAAERIAPAMESARETARESVLPRVEHAREAAGRAWESAVRPTAETFDTTRKMSRRARRKARKAGLEAGRRTRAARAALRGEETTTHRWRWMIGALTIGAAIGAIGALISRRRAPEWEEYESTTGGTTTGHGTREKVTDMADAARRKTGQAVETAKEKASEAVEAARSKATTAKKRLTETGSDRPQVSEPAVTGPTVTGTGQTGSTGQTGNEPATTGTKSGTSHPMPRNERPSGS